ncbi:hypothetical protein PM082_006460 [Marasmius tenuissimus]|nr:hypothetical protein PM082_006460 [Marasmius tenuissimus]
MSIGTSLPLELPGWVIRCHYIRFIDTIIDTQKSGDKSYFRLDHRPWSRISIQSKATEFTDSDAHSVASSVNTRFSMPEETDLIFK